jgi:hypothetical protein
MLKMASAILSHASVRLLNVEVLAVVEVVDDEMLTAPEYIADYAGTVAVKMLTT